LSPKEHIEDESNQRSSDSSTGCSSHSEWSRFEKCVFGFTRAMFAPFQSPASRRVRMVRFRLIPGGLMLLIAALSTVAYSHSEQLPGTPVSLAELDSVRGLACGELGSTTGESPCSFSPGACGTVATVRGGAGVDCTTPGSPCGSCTGGYNHHCFGGFDPYGTHLCSLTTPACCPVSTCMNGSTLLAYTCDCAGPATPNMGMRLQSHVAYGFNPGCVP